MPTKYQIVLSIFCRKALRGCIGCKLVKLGLGFVAKTYCKQGGDCEIEWEGNSLKRDMQASVSIGDYYMVYQVWLAYQLQYQIEIDLVYVSRAKMEAFVILFLIKSYW